MPLEQPRARVSIGGQPAAGLVACEVTAGGYFLAGRFTAAFALGAGAGYFAGLTNQAVLIEAAPDGIGFAAVLMGQVDAVRIEWTNELAVVCGRDLTALLIDTEISQSFVNQSASGIVQEIAEAHGLISNVTPTSALVGQYYQRDHARTALGLNARVTNEWELVTSLALAEGFVASVTTNVLNFGPAPVGVPKFVTPGGFSALTFDAVTALPGAATVKSWNCRNKAVVEESTGMGLNATIIRPNLVQAQAQALAQGHLQTLDQQRLIMQGRMPADTTLAPGAVLVLGGAGPGLDQSYVVDAVTRRLTGAAGFVQDIWAHAAGSV